MKKILTLLAAVALCSPMGEARTNWRFYVGGMYSQTKEGERYSSGESYVDKNGSFVIMGGMDIQFILKDMWHIETGLNYRHAPYSWWDDRGYDCLTPGEADWLSIPARFGYRMALNDKNLFEFGLGPYISYAFSSDFDENKYARLNVGISPVVTFKHRAFSVSLRYETPMFYNGMKNECKHMFAVTVGVNFNGRKPNWDTIGAVLNAANAVLGAANEALGNTSDGGSYDTGSYDEGSSSGSKSRGDSGNKYNIGEQQAYNTDKSTYGRYESQLAAHFAGNQVMSSSQVRDAQRAMKKLREKWEKRGKSFPRSPYETR